MESCVREAKGIYRRKVEQQLRENNIRVVWEGMRTITGQNTKTRTVEGTMERANELNNFFNRLLKTCGTEVGEPLRLDGGREKYIMNNASHPLHTVFTIQSSLISGKLYNSSLGGRRQ